MTRLGVRLALLVVLPGAVLAQTPSPSNTLAIHTLLLGSWRSTVDSLLVSDSALHPFDGILPERRDGHLVLRSILDDFPGDTLLREAWEDYRNDSVAGQPPDVRALQRVLGMKVRARRQPPNAAAHMERWVWFAFSQIGFSRDSGTAVLYREYYCGRLCAGGDVYFLRKKSGAWSIIRNYGTFRS